MEDYGLPVFRSANTFGGQNTSGGWSPSRPGVIFITKTNGIDVWDFLDQSHKPSITLNLSANVITYFKFQYNKHKDGKQYLGYGDDYDGNFFLFDVPNNLKKPMDNELNNIKDFWKREIDKCTYVKARREARKLQWQELQRLDEIKKAKDEQEREMARDLEAQQEEESEDSYQNTLMKFKVELGMMTEEEFENIIKEKAKNK